MQRIPTAGTIQEVTGLAPAPEQNENYLKQKKEIIFGMTFSNQTGI